jgi:hypothetical protein
MVMYMYSMRFSLHGRMSLRPFSYLDGQTDDLRTCGNEADFFSKEFPIRNNE